MGHLECTNTHIMGKWESQKKSKKKKKTTKSRKDVKRNDRKPPKLAKKILIYALKKLSVLQVE